MTEIERKALALVNEVRTERNQDLWRDVGDRKGYGMVLEALCRAIEQHEAFRREVSDAVLDFKSCYAGYKHVTMFDRFIIPKPVDPVENVMRLVRAVANVHVIEAAIRELVGKAAPEDTNHD